jgi:hypothetical protein
MMAMVTMTTVIMAMEIVLVMVFIVAEVLSQVD